MFTAYNLRRSFNILDKNLLKAYLKALGPAFSTFQGSFEAFFGHSVLLGLEPEIFCAENLPSFTTKKLDIFEWNFYLQ